MAFKLKSHVQALDPLSGIWLPGVISRIDGDKVTVKWRGYNESSEVAIEHVRKPLIKRSVRLDPTDWKRLDPRTCQRGDQLLYKKPDGSTDILLIEENDPWNCRIRTAAGRSITYELLRELVPDAMNGLNETTRYNKQKDGHRECDLTKNVGETAATTLLKESDALNKQVQISNKNKKRKNLGKENEPPTLIQKKKKNTSGPKVVTKEKATVISHQTAVQENHQGNDREVCHIPLSSAEKDDLVGYGLRILQELEADDPAATVHEERTEDMAHTTPLQTDVSPSCEAQVQSMPNSMPNSPSPPPTILDEASQHNTVSLADRVTLLEVELEVQREKSAELERKLEELMANVGYQNHNPHPITPLRYSTPAFTSPEPTCLPRSEPPCLPRSEPPCLPRSEPPCPPRSEPSCPPRSEPPCTPRIEHATTPTTSYLIPTENNHFYHLRKIHANVISTSVNNGVTEATVYSNILVPLAHLRGRPSSLARELMRSCFTPYELATCNVRGVRKAALDPVRVFAIRRSVMELCSVPLCQQGDTWRECVKAMDTANRNARRYTQGINSV